TELGTGIPRFDQLVEHLLVTDYRCVEFFELEHAPRAWRVADSYGGVTVGNAASFAIHTLNCLVKIRPDRRDRRDRPVHRRARRARRHPPSYSASCRG